MGAPRIYSCFYGCRKTVIIKKSCNFPLVWLTGASFPKESIFNDHTGGEMRSSIIKPNGSVLGWMQYFWKISKLFRFVYCYHSFSRKIFSLLMLSFLFFYEIRLFLFRATRISKVCLASRSNFGHLLIRFYCRCFQWKWCETLYYSRILANSNFASLILLASWSSN